MMQYLEMTHFGMLAETLGNWYSHGVAVSFTVQARTAGQWFKIVEPLPSCHGPCV